MSYVLLSLSLSMFAVDQALTSLILYCIELTNFDILSGGAEMRKCMSSSNHQWCEIECDLLMVDKA